MSEVLFPMEKCDLDLLGRDAWKKFQKIFSQMVVKKGWWRNTGVERKKSPLTNKSKLRKVSNIKIHQPEYKGLSGDSPSFASSTRHETHIGKLGMQLFNWYELKGPDIGYIRKDTPMKRMKKYDGLWMIQEISNRTHEKTDP